MSFLGRRQKELLVLTTNDQLGDMTKQLVERVEKACVRTNVFLKSNVLRVGFTYEETLTKNIQAYGEANDAIEKYEIKGFPSFIANGKVLSHGGIPTLQILSKALGLKNEDLKGIEAQMKKCAEFQIAVIKRLTIEKSEAPPKLQVRLRLRPEMTVATEPEKVNEPRRPIVVEIQDSPQSAPGERRREPIIAAPAAPEPERQSPAPVPRFPDSVVEAVRRLDKTGFAWPDSCNICIYYNEASKRCGSLHADITDPLRPLCKTVRDSLPRAS